MKAGKNMRALNFATISFVTHLVKAVRAKP